ncbi:hypothetical protein BOTU111921_01450 [Bordetella tumbae]|uniref:hypothetical protein n=1 Tax=Bordetella tumbae TaxID=1649139 RepID=UPI0039F07681
MMKTDNNSVQYPELRFTHEALDDIAGTSSPVHGGAATNGPVDGMGPLHGKRIEPGDGEHGSKAQENASNHKAGFLSSLATYGWYVATLPVSLFNAVTSNLIAAGDATVSALLSILPGKRTEDSNETRANTTHTGKTLRPRPSGVHRGLPEGVARDYNELISRAHRFGFGLSERSVKAGDSSEPKKIADLVNVAKKIHNEAAEELEAIRNVRTSSAQSRIGTAGWVHRTASEFIKGYGTSPTTP